MAIHAICSLRNSGLFAVRHRVANLTFQSQLGVALVAEFDRLFDGLGLAGSIFVCTGSKCRCQQQSCEENCAVNQRH
jgi:hypothetical protein